MPASAILANGAKQCRRFVESSWATKHAPRAKDVATTGNAMPTETIYVRCVCNGCAKPFRGILGHYNKLCPECDDDKDWRRLCSHGNDSETCEQCWADQERDRTQERSKEWEMDR